LTNNSDVSFKNQTLEESATQNDLDSSSENSSEYSLQQGYFNPPISNYRQMNNLQNRITSNFEGNMFIIQQTKNTEKDDSALNSILDDKSRSPSTFTD